VCQQLSLKVAMECAKKRTLKRRYELVKETEMNPRSNAGSLGEKSDCDKTQVYSILKEKASIIQQYESNASGSACHSVQRSRNSPFSKINDTLYEWCGMQEYLS